MSTHKQSNVFIDDHQQHESFEQPCDRQINGKEDQQNNSDELDNENINDEEIDQLLDQQAQSKQEIVLKFKVNQLQKICNSLTNTNRKLIEKVTKLEEEKEARQEKDREEQEDRKEMLEYNKKQEQIFVDQYSELNTEFTEVESLIHQYKQSLDHFQFNVLADMKIKQQRLNKLKIQVKQLTDRFSQIHQEKEDVEKQNKQLETRNEGLILQIQNLQRDKQKLQQRLKAATQAASAPSNIRSHYLHHQPSTPTLYTYSQSNNNINNEYELPYEIQSQYQNIIDKLVKQLEYQKNIKKKMNQQIKRMAQQLMESEKQIMNKNKRLYEIEMKFLRSSKSTTTDSSNNNSYHPTHHSNNNVQPRSKNQNFSLANRQESNNSNSAGRQLLSNKQSAQNSRQNKVVDQKLNFKTFVLLELINGELDQDISFAERKIIGVKVIQFYERKIERQDYSNVMPQNLLICNFSHRKPQLLSIRKVGTSVYEQGQKTQESLVWNLAFILDNLFGQNQGVQDFDQILELTGQVLQKQIQNNKDSLLCMKEILCI